MPFCPKCRYEYVEGVKVCPDCNTELVGKLEEVKPKETPGELVTIATFSTPVEAEMAKLKLESEGIMCFLADETLSSFAPHYTYMSGGVRLQVVEEDARRAIELLR